MKKTIILAAGIIFLNSISGAQTYTEIFEGGWVSGMNDSQPVFVDLDDDGSLDMLVGTWIGPIQHFEQDTPGSTTFNLISENFSDIVIYNFTAPSIVDIDDDDLLDLIVGRVTGTLHHYEQEAVGSETFTFLTDNFNGIDVGDHATPTFTDLDGDGFLDLIIGEDNGSLFHYEQDTADPNLFTFISDSLSGINVERNSSPTFIDLDNDNLLDLIIGERFGKLHHYEQDGTSWETFTTISDNFNEINVGGWAAPCFTDLDDDGRFDLIVGEKNGNFFHYEQNAFGSTTFDLTSTSFISGLLNVGQYAAPFFIDLDNNGMLDMIVGELDGNLNHYEQDAAGSYSFTLLSESFSDIDVGMRSAPCFTDLDSDNLLDLIIGDTNGELHHYEQDAVGGISFTLITDEFAGIVITDGARPVFADINGDGLEDLIVGNTDGGVRYFQRNEETAVEADQIIPHTFKIFPNYPNPFNPVTTIQYSLPTSVNVTISIYNMLGETVKVLDNQLQHAGFHNVQWDGSDEHGRSVPSGIYICQIQAGELNRSLKLMLMR